MIPYHQDPEHAAHLQEAPRCQHVHANGQRCGSPALRGESHCYFHDRIASPKMYVEPDFPFIEDATSLQIVLMRVVNMLTIGHSVDYKYCALLLYALQIACANLKNLRAEHPRPEITEGEQPQPKLASVARQKVNGKNGEESSLAELLLGLLEKGRNGDAAAEPPRIPSRADYSASEQKASA
jgi:hypothetical protein